MAMNNRGLGRGIQALFEGNAETASGGLPCPAPFRMAPIEAILPNPAQPRKNFKEENLQELAASIKAHGILQPLLVRSSPDEDVFVLVAGERRLRAAKAAGLQQVPVLIHSLSDQEALVVTLLENLQREDLNPIEEARGLEALKDALNISLEDLATTLGQARSTISNSLRLLTLDPIIQKDIEDKRLSVGHAKILAGMGSREAMLDLHNQIIAEDLTTRQTTDAVAFWNEHSRFPWEDIVPELSTPAKMRLRKAIDPDIIKLGNDIGATLNCRAKVSGNADKGRISLAYETNEQLYDLLNKLGLTLTP